ncbi:hypothetical protein PFISCL1PPCAC_126, partial [Pristionchus fissidentatus]
LTVKLVEGAPSPISRSESLDVCLSNDTLTCIRNYHVDWKISRDNLIADFEYGVARVQAIDLAWTGKMYVLFQKGWLFVDREL